MTRVGSQRHRKKSGNNYFRAVFGPPIMANTAVTRYPQYKVM